LVTLRSTGLVCWAVAADEATPMIALARANRSIETRVLERNAIRK